jgi:hypothetical protein
LIVLIGEAVALLVLSDLVLARELHDELEALSMEVWLDDFSIELGQIIVRAIDRASLQPPSVSS